MSEIIDICVTAVNVAGRVFCDYAAGIFVQIAVLVAVLLCVDWLSRKRIRATLRYWIWMLVFVKLLLPPSLCVPTGIGYWLGRGEALPAPSVVPQIVEVAKPSAPASVELPIATPVVRSAESVPTVVKPTDSIAESRVSLTWQGGALLLWIAGVLVFAALVVQRWRFVKELIARSEPAAADQIDLLDQCRRRMNVRGPVSLRLLPDACSPAVCGLLRPTILAPRALLDRLPPEGLKAVLIHELAHVKRGDLWINSLQTVLQAAYFYNPLVWLASAIVRRVREQAVDEMAIVALGAQARGYGNTLIDIAEMAFLRPSPALRLIGVAESRKSLEGRIKHMMTRPIPKSAKVGVVGVFVVAAVGAILLPMSRAQSRTDTNSPNGEYKILLLDDRDPESRGKDVYDDRLYLMDSKGRIEGAVTGFNIDKTSGGSHVLAVDEKRRTLWVVENVGRRLWHFDLVEGKLLHQIPLPCVLAAAVDTATGNVWTVSGDQVGDERPLRVVSPAGQLVATYPIGGYDIAYSDRDDSFWVVGKRVTKIGKDGKVLCQLADEVSWLAVCVSVDQTTGTAWVVVRDHPNIPESKPELLAVDKNGRVLQRVDLGDLVPFSVAVDSDNGIVWVGCLGTTLRYTTQGEKLKSARFASGFSIAPGASGDSVIAASDSDLVMATVEDTGRVDVGFPPIEVRRDLLSSSQKWVAKVPWAGAKLESSPELARLPLDKDAHLKLADYPESKAKIEALGKALLLYANDYEDKLPDTLGNLRAYVDERNRRSYVNEADLKWLQDNVEYLGEGRNIADRPDLVVAYDKTVLRKGEGTVVLYLDSHVAFEGPHKLQSLGIASADPAGHRQSDSSEVFGSYEVNRSVADFPAGEDFSTPEAAYATINRMDRSDPAAWQKVSVARLAARLGGQSADRKRSLDAEWAKVLGNARIREVVVWNVTKAAVIAELPQEVSSKKIVDPFDVRYFQVEKGRWLNTGNDRFASTEAAKTKFTSWRRRETSQADAMRDPLAHSDEIQAAAGQLFDRLRAADYAEILSYYRDGKWDNDGWKRFPTLGLYTVATDYPSFALWCATHFKDNPIVSVHLGDVFLSDALVADKTGRPAVPYKLTLQDGSVLAGNLPFYLSQGKWLGLEGIDWHLWPNETR